MDHLVHGDGVKIHVTNVPAHRGVLHFLHQRGAARSFTSDFELDQDVFSRCLAHQRVNVTRGDLQRLRCIPAAVNDCGNITIAGGTNSSNFPVLRALQPVYKVPSDFRGAGDAFVASIFDLPSDGSKGGGTRLSKSVRKTWLVAMFENSRPPGRM